MVLCVGGFSSSHAQGVELKTVAQRVGYVVMMDF
jgi:hypothetical protein